MNIQVGRYMHRHVYVTHTHKQTHTDTDTQTHITRGGGACRDTRQDFGGAKQGMGGEWLARHLEPPANTEAGVPVARTGRPLKEALRGVSPHRKHPPPQTPCLL